MTTRIPLEHVKAHLPEYVHQLAEGGERIVVENDGTPEAALVSLNDLGRLEALDRQAAEDEDLRRREEAFRRGLEEDGISVQWSSGPPVDWSKRPLIKLSGKPLSEQIIEERG